MDYRGNNLMAICLTDFLGLATINMYYYYYYGFKFERESGRDYSLELRELVLAFEDMITTFTTILYFHLW